MLYLVWLPDVRYFVLHPSIWLFRNLSMASSSAPRLPVSIACVHIFSSPYLSSKSQIAVAVLMPRGNVAQLGLALARTFAPGEYRTYGIQLPDQQALVSLLSFLVGTTIGRFEGRLGGGRCRLWLVSAAFTQCLMAMAGALTAHYAGESGVAL